MPEPKEAAIVVLQILVGVEAGESDQDARTRATALWESEVDLNDAVVRIADPLVEFTDIDPELNNGYGRVANVCGNVLKR